MSGQPQGLRLRESLIPGDEDAVEEIVRSCGQCSEIDIELAIDAVHERRNRGEICGYQFLLAERERPERRTVGYVCHGEVPRTVGSHQILWIAVHQDERGKGIGRWLLESCESWIAERGGRRVYAEIPARGQYQRVQNLYLTQGYCLEARLDDFYAPGVPKLVYLKALA